MILHCTIVRALAPFLALGLFGGGCLGMGAAVSQDAGSSGIDCGAHGSAHGDHCHCYQGYLFDGDTCVDPGEVAEICGEQEPGSAAMACRCPAEGICPCVDGEIVTYEAQKFCQPSFGE